MTDENTLAEAPGDDEAVTTPEAQEDSAEGFVTDEERAEAAVQDDGGEGEPEEGDRHKKLPGSRREKIRNEMLRRENAELLRRLEETERRLPKSDGGGDQDQEPQEADFNGDYFAYQNAHTAWTVRKAIREENSRRDNERRSAEQRDVWRERAIAHQERVEEVKADIKDYDQVLAAAKHINVAPEVAQEILSSEKSALLSYYLAKNPDKLLALNEMSGRELAREMGRLEGSVRMPSSKRQTEAPKPLTTLRGGASPGFDPLKSSMEEYMAKRRAGWSG